MRHLKTIAMALLLAAVIRAFLAQLFVIPSGSMMPTLLVGDYIFVNKLAYGYSKYSLPFSPDLFKGRILSREPKRGDVVVFRSPQDPDVNFVKRLVGLPGDTVQMRYGVLFLNRQPVQSPGEGLETIDGATFETLDLGPNLPGDDTREFLVPDGQYFVMGDNRDNSDDSRFHVGFVPAENLVGRASMIFYSMDGWSFRFDRILKQLH